MLPSHAHNIQTLDTEWQCACAFVYASNSHPHTMHHMFKSKPCSVGRDPPYTLSPGTRWRRGGHTVRQCRRESRRPSGLQSKTIECNNKNTLQRLMHCMSNSKPCLVDWDPPCTLSPGTRWRPRDHLWRQRRGESRRPSRFTIQAFGARKNNANVPCTICPVPNLVWSVGIRLTLCHQVLDDVDVTSLGGKENGSVSVLQGLT